SRNALGGGRSLYRHWAVRRALQSAPLVITNSNVAANILLETNPNVGERLVVSYEGVEHDVFHPNCAPGEASTITANYGVTAGYVLWVSNLYPYKQIDLLLEAYAKLSPGERQAHPLLIVGGDWNGTRRIAERLAA